MRILFIFSWLALLLIPLGFYVDSTYLIWFSGIIAIILIIKIGLTPCNHCGERVHLYIRRGMFAKFKIGLPLGRCDHCGESYI